ncbi:MAG: DUF4032 domain-containing protein [Actinomycetales bacterium]|nr:DUF4032 domain-containing protein [Actinomycetales bacterium]
MTGRPQEPELAFLPWHLPLEEWPEDLVVALPRGISRHIVRFVRLNGVVYAIKEVEAPLAQREYELLFDLGRRDLPVVEPVGVVLDRHDRGGDVLPAALITQHLQFSLPYRALFSSSLRQETANRLLDALAVLLVQLHLAGFSWNDCSLSNTLFRRDAGAFAAYLVDAETGELHPSLSIGQREYDLETAATNVAGELMDLQAGGRLQDGIDPIVTGVGIRTKYDALWEEVTGPIVITRDDRYLLEARVRRLNELGFDVAELQVSTQSDGEHITVSPKVVDAGHHSRRLIRLTGLDVEENQARRLLNDLDSYRLKIGIGQEDEELSAHRWVTDRFERVMSEVPPALRGKLEPAEIFHEVLEHRWFMSERAGASVPFEEAIRDYVDSILSGKPDEQSVLGARIGQPSDETAELRIVLPPEPTQPGEPGGDDG